MYNNTGFTLVEMILCMVIISCCGLLVMPCFYTNKYERHTFIYEYLHQQSNAMLLRETVDFKPSLSRWYGNYEIHFNDRGHVNRAQTVSIIENNLVYDYTIQLGGGRIVSK